MRRSVFSFFAGLIITGLLPSSGARADTALLNVSYDPTRPNSTPTSTRRSASHWKAESGRVGHDLRLALSGGVRGAGARGDRWAQEADVVTLALASDIDAIASHERS